MEISIIGTLLLYRDKRCTFSHFYEVVNANIMKRYQYIVCIGLELE